VGPNCISVINIVSGVVCLPFREKVKGFFRAKVIEPTSPLDLGDLFDFGIYMNILEECLKIEEVDAVLMAHAYSSLLERKGAHRLAHAVRELAARYNRHCCGTGNRSPCAPSPKARKSSPLRKPWSILPSVRLTRPWRPWPPPGTATANRR
jgi:hypothetical protein